MAKADLDGAVQAALVLMKNPRFPTAEQAARAISCIVKEVEGAELLATLRRRLDLDQPTRGAAGLAAVGQ